MEGQLVTRVFWNIYQQANLLIVTIIFCYEWSTNLSISFSTVSHLSILLVSFFFFWMPSSSVKEGKNLLQNNLLFLCILVYSHLFCCIQKKVNRRFEKGLEGNSILFMCPDLNHPLPTSLLIEFLKTFKESCYRIYVIINDPQYEKVFLVFRITPVVVVFFF